MQPRCIEDIEVGGKGVQRAGKALLPEPASPQLRDRELRCTARNIQQRALGPKQETPGLHIWTHY